MLSASPVAVQMLIANTSSGRCVILCLNVPGSRYFVGRSLTGYRGLSGQVGSDFWMAPEVHSNRRATKASDVFSLHVVMWEVGELKPRVPTARTGDLPTDDNNMATRNRVKGEA